MPTPTPHHSQLATRNSQLAVRHSLSVLQSLGLVLVIGGYLGPWVGHKTAALAVTGLELAEFAKFFPQVQGGTVSITRELFYLPFVAALILLVLLAGRLTARLVRLIAPLFAAALLLVVLLPYPIVDAARHALTTPAPFVLGPQHTRQLVLVVVGMVLVLLAPLAHRLPRRSQAILAALLALAAAIPALWQFVLLRPLVIALYNGPVGLGWGLIAYLTGLTLLLLATILAVASITLFAIGNFNSA